MFLKLFFSFKFVSFKSIGQSYMNIYLAYLQVAFQQADYAGWNIWAAINDRPLLPFRFIFLLSLYFG